MAQYASSEQIHVFPCANRGSGIDLESKINTEYNLIHLPSLLSTNSCYSIEKTETILRFVLNGYYVEVSDTSIIGMKPLYAALKTGDCPLSGGSTIRSSKAICNWQSGTFELDINGRFNGIAFANNADELAATGATVMQVLDASGELADTAPLKLAVEIGSGIHKLDDASPTVSITPGTVNTIKFNNIIGRSVAGATLNNNNLVLAYTDNTQSGITWQDIGNVRGEKGDTGTGLNIKGSCDEPTTALTIGEYYAIEHLQPSHYPKNAGDTYIDNSGHCFMWMEDSGTKGNKYRYIGALQGPAGISISDATANITGGTGTPSVSVTLSTPSNSSRTISFTFKNLKGATGATGPQGQKGADGLTTRIQIAGSTLYEQEGGTITLPASWPKANSVTIGGTAATLAWHTITLTTVNNTTTTITFAGK